MMATAKQNQRGKQQPQDKEPPRKLQPAGSAVQLAELASHHINQRISQQASTVANGGCDSHESYLRMTGAIKGMQLSIQIIEAALKGLDASDLDDNSLPEMQ
jgi:hypothetical protein